MHAVPASEKKKSDTARSERSRMEINFGHSLCNPALPIQIESSPPIHTSGSVRPAGMRWLRLTDRGKKIRLNTEWQEKVWDVLSSRLPTHQRSSALKQRLSNCASWRESANVKYYEAYSFFHSFYFYYALFLISDWCAI